MAVFAAKREHRAASIVVVAHRSCRRATATRASVVARARHERGPEGARQIDCEARVPRRIARRCCAPVVPPGDRHSGFGRSSSSSRAAAGERAAIWLLRAWDATTAPHHVEDPQRPRRREPALMCPQANGASHRVAPASVSISGARQDCGGGRQRRPAKCTEMVWVRSVARHAPVGHGRTRTARVLGFPRLMRSSDVAAARGRSRARQGQGRRDSRHVIEQSAIIFVGSFRCRVKSHRRRGHCFTISRLTRCFEVALKGVCATSDFVVEDSSGVDLRDRIDRMRSESGSRCFGGAERVQ